MSRSIFHRALAISTMAWMGFLTVISPAYAITNRDAILADPGCSAGDVCAGVKPNTTCYAPSSIASNLSGLGLTSEDKRCLTTAEQSCIDVSTQLLAWEAQVRSAPLDCGSNCPATIDAMARQLGMTTQELQTLVKQRQTCLDQEQGQGIHKLTSGAQPLCRPSGEAPAANSTTTVDASGNTTQTTKGQNVGSSGIKVDTIKLAEPIGGVSELPAAQGIPRYIALVFRYAIGIVATVAIIMIVYGGFRYLTGSVAGDIERGKEIIRDALIGMILVLASYAILYTINPDTVSLRWPALPQIANVKFQTQDLVNKWTNTCVIDANCAPGRVCMLSMSPTGGPDAGQCSAGGRGERCKCVGTGCGAAAHADQLRGTSNNCWTVDSPDATLQCQGNMKCISAGGFKCDFFNPASSDVSDYVCGDGLAFSPCDMRSDPKKTCGTVEGTQLYCEQSSNTSCDLAGVCLYGDWRDDKFKPSEGSGIDEKWKPGQTSKPENGACVTDQGPIDPNQGQQWYKCNGIGKCMTSSEGYKDMFGSTQAYFLGSVANLQFPKSSNHKGTIPTSLEQSLYLRNGCRKLVGADCKSDDECPTRCIAGKCAGFCALTMRDDVSVPASLTYYNDVLPGDLPEPAYLKSVCQACSDNEWSLLRDFADPFFSGATDQLKRENYLGALKLMGLNPVNNYVPSTCFPKRPAGQKCFDHWMCQSGTCQLSAPVPLHDIGVTYLNDLLKDPMDGTTGGPGTCQ